MYRRSIGSLGLVTIVLAAALLPLGGCSSVLPGASSFGNNKLEPVEIANIGDYTADRAMSEAQAHFRNNDFGYSATLYKRVVELSPKDPRGYVGLGASYDRLGRFDLSDRVYQTLYALTGGSAQYYNNVGYSYMLRGNLTAALTNFRKAKAIDPDNIVIANNLQILANAAQKA
ncbi:MAG TPA: tetratricopeptide repeat protein [Devosia sp.]|nr:tetratricopeptide repeat protein [Devosia sp.]